MVSNPYQKRAATAYSTNAHQGMSEQELTAQVLRKMIGHLTLARDAYLDKNLELMVEKSGKAIHILDILRGELLGGDALKDPKAEPAARFLIQTYTDAILRTSNVLRIKPPENEFTAIIEMLTEVYKAWTPAKEPQPADSAPTIHTAG